MHLGVGELEPARDRGGEGQDPPQRDFGASHTEVFAQVHETAALRVDRRAAGGQFADRRDRIGVLREGFGVKLRITACRAAGGSPPG